MGDSNLAKIIPINKDTNTSASDLMSNLDTSGDLINVLNKISSFISLAKDFPQDQLNNVLSSLNINNVNSVIDDENCINFIEKVSISDENHKENLETLNFLNSLTSNTVNEINPEGN